MSKDPLSTWKAHDACFQLYFQKAGSPRFDAVCTAISPGPCWECKGDSTKVCFLVNGGLRGDVGRSWDTGVLLIEIHGDPTQVCVWSP